MDRVSLMTRGLFFSWLAHDLEELATTPGWTHPAFDKLPFLPKDIRRHGCSREHVYLGIGLMGVLMAAAPADGYRTRGCSPVYQAALYGYGMHTFSHLAITDCPRPALHPGSGDGVAGRPALLDLCEADSASPWGRGAPSPMGDPRLPRHRRCNAGWCVPGDNREVGRMPSRRKVTLTE